MPTRKPRLMISLPDDLRDVLAEFADAVEKPMSAAIVGLLEEMKPQLLDLTKVIRHAKAGKKTAAKRALQHMVGNAMAEVMLAEQLPLKPTK